MTDPNKGRTGYLSNTELREAPIDVNIVSGGGGVGGATGGLTDTELRATPVPVSGTVSVGTVPVTGTVAVSNFPATQPVSGSVSVSNLPATQAVSGTVTATGPVTNTEIRATPLPVSGSVSVSNFPATQPVSLAASVAVTGPATDTQLRATPLPVSGAVTVSGTVTATGPLTDTQLRATPVPVSGTVSATVSGSVTATGPLTDTQLRATPVPVSGTVTATGPLTDTQLRATPLPVSGTVAATQSGTWTVQPGNTVNTSAWKVDGSAVVQPVSAPTLTKGAQAANGFSTQDLKDAGRVIKVYTAVFSAATTEALVTLTPVADGVAGGTGTSFAVTSAKRLRLTGMSLNTRNAGAAAQGVVCNLRTNPSGAAVLASPLLATVGAGTELAIANVVGTGFCPLDIELSGTMQLAVSQAGTATAGNTFTLLGYEY